MTHAIKGQPKQVWIVAFAAVIGFMAIGLVDPIMQSIAESLDAEPSQVTMLFTSYLGVQVVAMLVTGWCSARFGAKRTVLFGLGLIVAATLLCALATGIGQLIWLRGLWGLGNALFIATALSVIVGAASGGQQVAILLYEAALGVGLSVGPLLGAALGKISWRGPFAGTAILMAVALVLVARWIAADHHHEREPVRLRDPLKALGHGGLLRTGIGSALYTAAFFAVLAWIPFVLGFGPITIGLIFFGWGVCVAVAGVAFAPRLAARLGEQRALIAAVLSYAVLMALISTGNHAVVIASVIASGLVSGLLNTLFTGRAMSISDAPRGVASAGYNFCRWFGGAVAATLVSYVAMWTHWLEAPFLAAAVLCVGAAALLSIRDRTAPEVVPATA
ncbi:MFS transporter [Salininema proteolyticum]|uniref:MFS transporter n=1 Tax=Salininema proteolyticum TaxID=1607685 RepID=A0ABV8TVZ1_9ACTN